jgi:hypothetical protein
VVLRDTSESDDELDHKSCVKVMDLKIGEQDPETNGLVAIEMRDTQRIGFRKGCDRKKKKSIDRIFGKVGKIGVTHDVDESNLRDLPRRSLISGLELTSMRNDESDEENEDTANRID